MGSYWAWDGCGEERVVFASTVDDARGAALRSQLASVVSAAAISPSRLRAHGALSVPSDAPHVGSPRAACSRPVSTYSVRKTRATPLDDAARDELSTRTRAARAQISRAKPALRERRAVGLRPERVYNDVVPQARRRRRSEAGQGKTEGRLGGRPACFASSRTTYTVC